MYYYNYITNFILSNKNDGFVLWFDLTQSVICDNIITIADMKSALKKSVML